MKAIILASSSPRRKKLLREHKVAFRVAAPSYHEKDIPGLSPSALVKRHALGKALSAARKVREGIVVSADTLVFYGGMMIGKPKNLRDAQRILMMLQGRTHVVYTGVTVLKVRAGRIERKAVFSERTKIQLRPMSRLKILSYFRRVNPLDKAGAYAIQSKSGTIVAGVSGSFSNAVGLPMERLLSTLRTI